MLPGRSHQPLQKWWKVGGKAQGLHFDQDEEEDSEEPEPEDDQPADDFPLPSGRDKNAVPENEGDRESADEAHSVFLGLGSSKRPCHAQTRTSG